MLLHGKIEQGKINVDEKIKFQNYIKKNEGKAIRLEVRTDAGLRSTQENRYYWGVLIKSIADETGQDIETVHNTLKYKFLTERDGEFIKTKSTAELTVPEFENYCSEVRQWASEFLNLYLPLPNENIDYFK